MGVIRRIDEGEQNGGASAAACLHSFGAAEDELTRASPPYIAEFVQTYPFFEGAIVKDGKLYGVYMGAHQDRLFLLNVGQIEHVVWTLAAMLETQRDFNLGQALTYYAWSLKHMVQTQAAFDRGWVKPGAFFDCSAYEQARLVPTIPEGIPAHLAGQNLRSLLGSRCPELDKVFKNGDAIEVYFHRGDGNYLCKTVHAELPLNKVLSLYTVIENRRGETTSSDDVETQSPPAKESLQMAAASTGSASPRPGLNSKKHSPRREPQMR